MKKTYLKFGSHEVDITNDIKGGKEPFLEILEGMRLKEVDDECEGLHILSVFPDVICKEDGTKQLVLLKSAMELGKEFVEKDTDTK